MLNQIWTETVDLPITSDNFSDVITDKDGNYFICGTSFNRTTNLGTPFVSKVDKDGNVLWSVVLPKTENPDIYNSFSTGIVTDSQGNAYVAAQESVSNTPGQFNDIYRVYKISPIGLKLWEKVYPWMFDLEMPNITLGMSNDNLYVVMSTDTGLITPDVLREVRCLKLNLNDGNTLNDVVVESDNTPQTYRSEFYDRKSFPISDNDIYGYICGYSNGPTGQPGSEKHALMKKFNLETGALVWVFRHSGTESPVLENRMTKCAIDHDGNIIGVGWTDLDNVTYTSGRAGLWKVRESDGTFIDYKSFDYSGINKSDYFSDITINRSSGKIYLSGYGGSPLNWRITQLNPDLSQEWTETYDWVVTSDPNVDHEFSHGIDLDEDAKVVVVGGETVDDPDPISIARIQKLSLPEPVIDPNANVNPDATIGGNTTIGEANVGSGVVIGEDCVIEDGASIKKDSTVGNNTIVGVDSTVRRDAVVGDDCELGISVTVGKGAELKDGASVGDGTKIRKNSIIDEDANIGSDVVIGKNCNIGDTATAGNEVHIRQGSVIGNNANFADEVGIGRDCELGNGVILGEGTKIRKECVIGNGFSAGIDCLIKGGCTIGNNVTLGNNVTIKKNTTVPDDTNIPDDTIYP